MAGATRRRRGRGGATAGELPLWVLLGVIWFGIWIVGWYGYQAAVYYQEHLLVIQNMFLGKNLARIGDLLNLPGLREPYLAAEAKAATLHSVVIWWLLGFLSLCALLVGVTYGAARDTRAVGFALLAAALPALAVGLFAPLMMIAVTGPLSFPLNAQSKSIMASIGSLFGDGQYLLGAAIVLFSVLVPTTKTLVMFYLATQGGRGTHLHRFVHLIGPWSMAEVFVVAALLVFFGNDGKSHTHAVIEPGTWYFMSYVLMSLAASILL